jgi:hypothetical protein
VRVGFSAPGQRIGHQLIRVGFGRPVEESALFPFGDTLLADGASAEFALQGGFNFREIIDPFDQAFPRFAVAQALIQFLAHGLGEAGDFTIAAHRAQGEREFSGGFFVHFSPFLILEMAFLTIH